MFGGRVTSTIVVCAAVFAAACGDIAAPRSRSAPVGPLYSSGAKLGQCFLQLGVTGTQVEPGADGNATATAPAGEVVTQVAVKAGTPCWFTPPGVSGSYTISVEGVPCYVVSGLGSAIATVTRAGAGPACKDISHVELVSAAPPPTTGFLQLCVTLVGANPPPSALTTPIQFVVAGRQLAVAPASCAAPIELPAGSTVIVQQPTLFIGLIGAMTQPDGQVEGVDVLAQTATVTVVAGSTTIVTIIDLWVPDPGGDH